MRQWILILVIWSQTAAAENDWLGEEQQQTLLRISAGGDSENGEAYATSIATPFFAFSELRGYWAEQHGHGDYPYNSRQLYGAWQSDPLRVFSVGVSYFDLKNSDSYDSVNADLFFDYEINSHWTAEALIGFGEIEFDFQSIQMTVDGLNQTQFSETIDRLAFGAGIAYTSNHWGSRIAVTYYDIEPLVVRDVRITDIDALDTQEAEEELLRLYYHFLVNKLQEQGRTEEEAVRRTNLFYLLFADQLKQRASEWAERQQQTNLWLNSQMNSQARWKQSQLANYDIDLSLYFLVSDLQLEVGALVYENYLQSSIESQAFLQIGYDLTAALNLSANLSHNFESNDNYYELIFGVAW